MNNMKLTSLSLAMVMAFSTQATTKNDDIENIEVVGSYIKGYGAHDASGASRLDLAIVDIPQSVSVVTSAQMDDFQLKDINAVLDTATGVMVERIETDRTYFTARGFDITNFQIDGVGLPLTAGNNHADEDTAIYDRIEIIRGANGLMTGVGNPSATVNFIRKRPEASSALNLTGSYGSWNNKRLEVDGTLVVNEDLAFRGVAVAQDRESYLDRYQTDKSVLYFFVDYNLTESTNLSLSHAINDNAADGNLWGANPLFYSDGTPTNYDPSLNTSADWSNWNVKKQNTVLELTHAINENWELRGTYSFKTIEEDSELFYVYGVPDRATELGLNGWASEYLHDEDTQLIDLYLKGYFELFGNEHQFVVGANHSSMDYTDSSLYDYTTGHGFPVLPAFTEWDGNTPKPTFTEGATGAEVERTQNAVYFTARFKVSEDLHIITGGRQNDWDVEGQSYGTEQTSGDSKFIPYLGAVYQLNEQLVAYANYTETFLSQTEKDVNEQFLDPIVGDSKEIGIKAQLFDDQFIATFAYFDILQNNLATLDPATAELAPELQRYMTADGLTSSGFELDFAGELLPGLQTSIGLTKFDIDGPDTDATALVKGYTPDTIFKMAVSYEVPQLAGLTIGANYRWQDDISRIQSPEPLVVTEQKAYGLLNLMMSYEVSNQVSVSFNAGNVTDEKYLNSLYWAQSFYGAPANYNLSLKWTL